MSMNLGPGVFEDVPHAVYLGDPCREPSLSSSIAHTLVAKSPLRAWSEHPRMGRAGAEEEKDDDDTDATRSGTLLHSLLLGGGPEFVVVNEKDWRKNVAKEAREAARAEGKVAVLADKMDAAKQTAAVCRGKLADHDIVLADGINEITIVWEQLGALCRCRVDHWRPDRATIVDLKGTFDADPKGLPFAADAYGYDIQHAAYVAAIEATYPELAGRGQMRFASFERKAPYDVVIWEPDDELKEMGALKWKRAIEEWNRCRATGVWPGFASGVVKVPPSAGAKAREMDRMINAMGDDNGTSEF